MSQPISNVTQQAKVNQSTAIVGESESIRTVSTVKTEGAKAYRSGLRDFIPRDWEARKARLAAWDAAQAAPAAAPQPQPPK